MLHYVMLCKRHRTSRMYVVAPAHGLEYVKLVMLFYVLLRCDLLSSVL
jgi:hypothetical protein